MRMKRRVVGERFLAAEGFNIVLRSQGGREGDKAACKGEEDQMGTCGPLAA